MRIIVLLFMIPMEMSCQGPQTLPMEKNPSASFVDVRQIPARNKKSYLTRFLDGNKVQFYDFHAMDDIECFYVNNIFIGMKMSSILPIIHNAKVIDAQIVNSLRVPEDGSISKYGIIYNSESSSIAIVYTIDAHGTIIGEYLHWQE